jgi:hypothetical protein
MSDSSVVLSDPCVILSEAKDLLHSAKSRSFASLRTTV